jgi:hypothetical protein
MDVTGGSIGNFYVFFPQKFAATFAEKPVSGTYIMGIPVPSNDIRQMFFF